MHNHLIIKLIFQLNQLSVFIDADKKHYSEYLAALMGDHLIGEWSENNLPVCNIARPLIKNGALIIVDNTLWKGLVLTKVSYSIYMHMIEI